jgi:uncharacterized protein YukE
MSDVMRVDSVALRQAAPRFSALSGQLDGVFRQLAAALAAEGECWGTDDTGKAFAKEYLPAAQQIADAGREVADAVEDVGARLVKVADLADAAEARAVDRLT